MPKQETKDKIVNKLFEFLDTYSTALVCEIKDLPANNIHRIRKDMRETKSEVLCGKTVRKNH
jgi:ribosomal protein L10